MILRKLVSSTLAPLNIEVFQGWYNKDLNKIHITFIEYDNEFIDFSDDDNTSEEHYIQLDLWSENLKDIDLMKDIKKLMKSKWFQYQGGQEIPETLADGRVLYRYMTRWLYVEEY